MLEVDVIKLDSKGVCVGIRRMTLEQWKSFKQTPNFTYRAYQLGYHSFKINQ